MNNIIDEAAGKAHKSHGESIATFIASLTTSVAILGVGIVSYILLKWKYPAYYYQRSNPSTGAKWQPSSVIQWTPFSSVPDLELKHASGFDNYLFDRYLQIVLKIFIHLGLIILPILLPLNFIGGKNEFEGVRGLDHLSFSNISLSHTKRYWAHLILAMISIISICYAIQRELWDYSRLRDSLGWGGCQGSCLHLTSTSVQQLSVDTIERRLRKICGGVHEVIITRDFSTLRDKIILRDALIRRLETAETTLIIKATYQRNSLQQAKNDAGDNNITSLSSWEKYLHSDYRPSMRLPLFTWFPTLPLLGPRVDTINHLRTEIARYNLEIDWDQRHPKKFPVMNSAMVHFNRPLSAPLATLALKARLPSTWTLRQSTVEADTIWCNSSIRWWQKFLQTFVIYFLIALLIVGFAFPVAIIGSISQVEYLVQLQSHLQWVSSIPSWLIAFIQGVLPPTMLALVTAAIPVVIRLLANMQGHNSRQTVERHVQIYYFTFLFVQVFLTVSLSAGITTLVGDLKDNITSTPEVLARNLPKACNYFFSFILIHTFTTVTLTLVDIKGILSLLVLSPLFDKTVREKWERGQNLGQQNWGTFLPVFTNLACIGMIYSIIAPLILLFIAISFGALWLLYRSYPPKLTEHGINPNGLFYPTALKQLFVGVYFMELCLTGLFFLVRDKNGRAACTAQAIIMIFTTVLTGLFHFALDYGNTIPWVRRYQGMLKSSVALPRKVLAKPAQDQVLTVTRPVVWIPKDELGVADTAISYLRQSHKSIWISNQGASVDTRGRLTVWGDLSNTSESDDRFRQ